MPSDSPVSPAPFFARVYAGLWILVGLWAIVGIGSHVALSLQANESPTNPRGVTLAGLSVAMTLIFHLPALVMAWLMRRLCIAADARGLWFRGAFKSRFVAWPQIEDYELRAPTEVRARPQSWICVAGKWQKISPFYEPIALLRERIRAEATQSRAREWQLAAVRKDGEWPKTWEYRVQPAWKMRALAVGFIALIFALKLGPLLFETAQTSSPAQMWADWRALDATMKALYLATPLLLLGMLALFSLPNQWRENAKRQFAGQTIVAEFDGLIWRGAGETTRLKWDEIADYYVEDVPGIFTTSVRVIEGGGRRIVFGEIEDIGSLCALIATRATNSKSSEWRASEATDSDTLGGASSLHKAGSERKIYHYRTRTTRAMLLFGATMLAAIIIRMLADIPLSNGQMPTTIDRYVGLIFVVPIAPLLFGGTLAFWRASIQTDADGLTQRGIWAERNLRWDEIESFTFNGYFYAAKGARTTIRFWLVAANQSLQAEIETRGNVQLRRTDRPKPDDE